MLEYQNELARITLELQKAASAAEHSRLYSHASVAALGKAFTDNSKSDAVTHFHEEANLHGNNSDTILRTLYEQLDNLLDKIPRNPENDKKVAKINHMLVSMYLHQRAVEHTFSSSEEKALQLQVLAIGENLHGTDLQDRQVVQNSPVRLRYLRESDKEDFKEAKQDDATHIGINIRDKNFNIKLSGDSSSIVKQADDIIHTIYGLQHTLGSDEAAKALAAIAEMHIYVRTIASNYRHEHNGTHPSISEKTIADFDYIGLAMKRAHAQWIENGSNAAIEKWNKEKQKLGNFNNIEKDNKRTWVGREIKNLTEKPSSPFDFL